MIYVPWIIFEIHVLNHSTSKYVVTVYKLDFSVGFCENISQSDNSKVTLIGSKFKCLP